MSTCHRGPAAFLLPANGYQDFGRAIRQKFIIEISGRQPRFAPSVASR